MQSGQGEVVKKRLNLLSKVVSGRRPWVLLGVQGAVVVCALLAAWLLRFEFTWANYGSLLWAAPVLLGIRILSMRLFKLHYGWWQFTGLNEAYEVFKSTLAGSLLFFAVMNFGFSRLHFPKSIYVLECVFSVVGLLSIRVFTSALAESVREDLATSKRVLIVGAGFAAQ